MSEPNGESEGYSLICPFLDSSQSYCCGFELGQLFSQMQTEDEIAGVYHVDNEEQITLLANRTGWEITLLTPATIETGEAVPGWSYIEMRRK